jgi:hypothetical protein
MNAVLFLTVVGALAGTHAATWGGFKDSPFEGFRPASFWRSAGLGAGVALLVGLSGLAGSAAVLVAVGLCYAAERLVTEWWKAILREDAQSAYSIPMRLALHGRPVDARLPRYAVGIAVAGGLVGACVLTANLESELVGLPWWGLTLLLGSGGWLTAVGGAWKDAPVEGFELAKFFRSPVVGTAWGCLLLPFSSSVTVTAVAAAGLSVATIETYKTFLAGGPPGKFANKLERFEVGAVRERCRRVHGTLYGVLAVVLAVALLETPTGSGGSLAEDVSLVVALMWASCFGALVLAGPNSATVESSRGPGRSAPRFGSRSDADIRGASS